jgi:hypothetical protein
MFLPPMAFGLLMGLHALVRQVIGTVSAVATVRDLLAVPVLFERSTANMVGYAMSLIIYLGLPAVLLDRLLLKPNRKG